MTRQRSLESPPAESDAGARVGARVGVVLPAAGQGQRMGGRKKPWLELAGRPLVAHALEPFLERADVVAVRLALTPEDAEEPPTWLMELDPRLGVVPGGATRAESVREALRALPPDLDLILVHDAARPLVTSEIVDRCVRAARRGVGAVAGWPATDTFKEVDLERRVVGTPVRSRLWHAQTPQGFPADLVRRAYEVLEDPASATDDAAVLERVGGKVMMVDGSPWNIKVTRPEDLPMAELFLRLRLEEEHRDRAATP